MAADDTTREGNRDIGRLPRRQARIPMTPIAAAERETAARKAFVGGRGGAHPLSRRRRGSR